MTMPWDTATPVSTAEAMQPDTPIPAAIPPPIPAVATNTATGQRVALDFAPQLQAAVNDAIDNAVAQHPATAALYRRRASRGRSDRTVAESAVLDVALAIVAALVTIISPDAPAVGVLWLAVAVLASRTMIQAALVRFAPKGSVT